MAGAAGGQDTFIIERLLKNGRRFSFIQAIRLIRHLILQQNHQATEEQIWHQTKIRPELSLSFPDTDIESIVLLENEPLRLEVTASFLGLYGSSSPLPTFYTEDLLYEFDDDESAIRDFIDLFNTSLYRIFYRIWAKYRLFYIVGEEKKFSVLQRLYSFTGLDSEYTQKDNLLPDNMLRYAGLLSSFPRSAYGLRTLLSDWFGENSLKIIECITRYATIPADQRLYLGESGNELGTTTVIGSKILDRMGKFRVQIGPVSHTFFQRLLPNRRLFKQLAQLIKLYLDQPLEWDVQLLLSGDQIECAQPGNAHWSHLGWDTWIFSGDLHEPHVEVTLSQFETDNEKEDTLFKL